MAEWKREPQGRRGGSPYDSLSSASFTVSRLPGQQQNGYCFTENSPSGSLSRPRRTGGQRMGGLRVRGDAPDLEQPLDHVPDDIVGRTGSGRDSDRELPRRKPAVGRHDGSRLRISIADLVRGYKTLFVFNMVRGRVLGPQLGQVPVLELLKPPTTRTMSSFVDRSSAMSVSCRSCVAEQIVSNAMKRR